MNHDFNPIRTLHRHAQYFPGGEVMRYGEQVWTYSDLCADIDAMARALASSGVVMGDRMAYLGHNSPTFIVTMFAAWRIGAVFQPLNFRLAAAEIAQILSVSEPTVIVVEPEHAEVMAQALDQVHDGDELLLVQVDDDPQAGAFDADAGGRVWLALTAWRDAAARAELADPAALTADHLALLLFTSGTTGRPKGVQLTHGNVWYNSCNVDSLIDTRRGDTNLANAPLFHIGALNALTIRCFLRGGRTIIHRTFDPALTLSDIERFQVNQVFMVPAMLVALRRHEDFAAADLSSVRVLICAGAPVPPVLLEQYAEKGIKVQQAWGLTETAPFATSLPEELTFTKPGSCGIPMPYTDVRVVDVVELNDVSGPGVTGELWVRGPNVTCGYWRDPRNTELAFMDGWFRTGDIGYRDEDGYLFIVDRLKDMIITGGENVYPAEVERVLSAHPSVQDVAVVGIPDPTWGETVAAAVVVDPGSPELTLEDIREFAGERLARYKLPRRLLIVDSLPRNGSGKLVKHQVQAGITGIVAQDGAA